VLPNERTDYLKARQHDLGLKKLVGKSLTVSKEPTTKKKSPLYCAVCEVDFNDSLSFVDHLNGKRHNRILGMNMKVETVSADRVKQKLDMLANKGPKKVHIEEPEAEAEEEASHLGKRSAADGEEAQASAGEAAGEEENEEDQEYLKEMALMGLPTKFK